jgi:hypothetical protein
MGWRDRYKVHPAADVFPMMSDAELDELAKDIKAKGLKVPTAFRFDDNGEPELLDGRNRLEAIDRAGIVLEVDRFGIPTRYRNTKVAKTVKGDPVAYILSANIHRRHLTKQERADLIVAAVKAGEKPTQVESVSKGGRGKVNEVKAKAIAAGAEHGISKGTINRSLSKSEGKTPKPKKALAADAADEEIPQATLDLLADVRGDLTDHGIDYVRPHIFTAKEAKLLGGEAEPTVGFTCEPCEKDAAKTAFDESVARVMAKPDTDADRVRRDLASCCRGDDLDRAEEYAEWLEEHPEEIRPHNISDVEGAVKAWTWILTRLREAAAETEASGSPHTSSSSRGRRSGRGHE